MQFPLFLKKNNNLILLFFACIIFILAFHDILKSIISIWTGSESAGMNHGPLVLLCTFYLLYIKKDLFSKLTPDPQRIGFIPLILLCIVFFLAELMQIQALQMLIIPLLVLSAIFAILGTQYLKMSLLPIVIIFFAFPIWPILQILQDITTWITELNLKILGRPVHVVGNYVYVTGGAFLIEEGCSGLRFLLIATILSLINSDLNAHNIKQGVSLLLVAIGLAFLANWLRVIIIVVIGDLTNMQHSLVSDHGNFGWVIFLVVVLIPYLLISRLVSRNFEAQTESVAVTKADYRPHYFLITMLVFISVPFLRYGQQLILKDSIAEIEIPPAIASWAGNNDILGSGAWKPDYKNATKELFKSYSGTPGTKIDLQIFHYSEQRQGAELINVENNIADGELWSVVPATEDEYLFPDNKEIDSVNTVEVMNGSREKKLVWYWYDVGGYKTSNQYHAKLFQLFAQLQGKNYANLITVSIVCENACKERERYLEDYVSGWAYIK